MNGIYVDTSAWVAMHNARDKYHVRAKAVTGGLNRQTSLITTNYVLDETLTMLLMDVRFTASMGFKRLVNVLQQQAVLKVVWVGEELAEQAWAVFERYNTDKLWSFTDCVSYAVMKRERLTEAFAFDHHFEQMGFAIAA